MVELIWDRDHRIFRW